ncbi:MAG TPA: hypothetical protein VL652_20830 [Kutzneria sp.]|nr:hypothetical protein [Kutzneria sp.]
MVKTGLLGVATAVLLTLGATFAASGVAAAATDTPPPSGDDRAVVHSGNAVTCEQAHLTGGIVKVTATVDASNTYVTVTGVPDGTVITGIVVKGSDAFNVYSNLGRLPWKNLHAPIAGNSGKPATISHWFACGTETTSSTSKTPCPPSSTSVTSSTSSTSSTSNTSTTTAPSSTTTTASVTTTTTAVAAATTTTNPATTPLAYTGFSGGWLVILAAILLLGGAALIAIPKLRARRR